MIGKLSGYNSACSVNKKSVKSSCSSHSDNFIEKVTGYTVLVRTTDALKIFLIYFLYTVLKKFQGIKMLAFKRKSFPDLFPEEVEILSGNKDEKYLNQKLELAFRFLDIKQERFRNIHRKELKINHLIYHFIVFEFSILDPNNLTLAQYAFNIIKNSSIIAEHQDQYGPYSVGLWDLDIRSSFTPEKEEFKVSSMEQSFMFFRKKIVGLSQDLLVSC